MVPRSRYARAGDHNKKKKKEERKKEKKKERNFETVWNYQVSIDRSNANDRMVVKSCCRCVRLLTRGLSLSRQKPHRSQRSFRQVSTHKRAHMNSQNVRLDANCVPFITCSVTLSACLFVCLSVCVSLRYRLQFSRCALYRPQTTAALPISACRN